jgi:phosphopantetheinyl transferase (holo-ACP synthase)
MIGLVPNLVASRIANRLDLGGPAYTVDAACASSLVAVDHAVRELRGGRCDLVIAGGVHHCHDVTFWSVFSQLGALSPSGRIRPFSRSADGLLIGEGTGMLALERLEDAERAGHRVYATIRGTGVSSDGRSATLMSPGVDGQIRALHRAYEDAGIEADVDLIEAHGTATTVGDEAELTTLRAVFGPTDGPPRVVGSVKSMIGHAMPAAGAAGLIKAVLAVHHGVLPPTLHAAEDPHSGLADAGFRVLARAESWDRRSGPRRAGVNAFGFGGINAHVVVEQHESNRGRRSRGAPPADRTTTTSTIAEVEPVEPVLRLAGADAGEVIEALSRWESQYPRGEGAPASTAWGDGQVRLAIVAPNARRLELARKVLERGRPWRGRNDLWFEPGGLLAGGGRMAFVYPGVEPVFDPQVDDLVAHFDTAPLPDLPQLRPIEQQSRGIVALGRVLSTVLARLGLRPDDVAGHSLGEWSGMVASELIPPADVDDEIERLQSAGIEVPDVVYVALGCGVETARAVIDGIEDVAVSHDNCPHQSVICGTTRAIAAVGPRIEARRLIAQELPFRTGFHTPLFDPYLQPLLAHMPDVPLQTPSVPMWSATTASRYPETREGIAEVAARHLLEPVRFRELVDAMYDDGIRVFVQMGVGSLPGFISDTLGDRDHLAVSANVANRSGMAQLRRLTAALWVQGATVDFGPLAGAARVPAADDARPSVSRTDGGARLSLGVPLVRLPDTLKLPGDSGGPAPCIDPDDPIEQLAAELFSDIRRAANDVLGAVRVHGSHQATPAAAPSVSETPDGPGPIAASPPSGRIAVGDSVTTVQRVGLDTQPWLADHSFFRQRDDWPDASDRFPLVPMTGMIEMMRDAAIAVRPELVAVAVSDIRALRWLAAEPPVEVRVVAAVLDEHTVKVTISGYARGVVHLASAYPAPPTPVIGTPSANRASPLSAPEMYERRWMFHGPQFQGVRSIDDFGDDGICGVVEMMSAPGAFLDQAGQLFGYWIQAMTTENFFALPMHIDRVDWFAPAPPNGTPVPCRVRILELGEREVRADLELLHEGTVLVRIANWLDRRFDSDDVIQEAVRWPERSSLSTRLTPDVCVVEEGWPDSATRELMMRRYLNANERAAYEALNPRAQRHSLLGRVAVKDAVRHHAWDRNHGPIFPGELSVTNDAEGRPRVDGPGADGVSISLAHTEAAGVAIAGSDEPVGIDIEAIAPRPESFESTVLTADERSLLGALLAEDRERWLTAAWCAKEAAAKAAGTGLGGRPGDFPVMAIDGERLRVGPRWIATIRWVGRRTTADGTARTYVIAWTEPERA